MINLLNCDCMEYMKGVPDKFFDLAIVDPPYGIGNWVQVTGNINHGRNGKPVKWNEKEHRPNEEYFSELKRISKERIIWGANYYNCFEGGNGAIIWDKKSPNPKFSRCEIASYSKHKRVGMVEIEYYGFIGEEKCFHPCAKPIALYKWLLKNYAKEGDKIFDSHGGSMSIAIACHDLKFDLTLCEIDKDYYEAGVKRFNEHKKQLAIF